MIYLVTSYAFRAGTTLKPLPGAATGPGATPVLREPVTGLLACSFRPGEAMRLRVWVTDNATHTADDEGAGPPLWEQTGLRYEAGSSELEAVLCLVGPGEDAVGGESRCDAAARAVHLPAVRAAALSNGTVYLHAYLTTQDKRSELHAQLNRFMPPPQPEKYKNLLESSSAERAEVERIRKEHETKPWVSYWRDNVTMAYVADMPPFDMGKTPSQIAGQLRRDGNHTYAPVFYVNDFWTYKDHYYALNETSARQLPLRIVFGPMGLWKWQLFTQMEQSFATQQQWGMASEMDDMKRVLSDTNPWFLGLTVVVSMVHMVFDFLAFKNDITFWKSRKSLEGLSVRSILISFACQLIIFLYLLDSETSWMILLSAGVSVAIEGWKITKTNDVTLSKRFPFVHLADKNSYKSKTKEFDEQATYYLSFLVYPLVAVYALYSLIYDTHKSYYSWLIGSLSGAVYMFGFLQMTPQLFINYKLKSVAHLPWRVFVYKVTQG